MATTTNRGHIARALDFFDRTDVYFGLGQTATPWPDELNPKCTTQCKRNRKQTFYYIGMFTINLNQTLYTYGLSTCQLVHFSLALLVSFLYNLGQQLSMSLLGLILVRCSHQRSISNVCPLRIARDPLLEYRDWETDRKSTRLNSSHSAKSRMPSSA